MKDLTCSCGGTFQDLGPEHIRIGKVERIGDRDWNEQSIPGRLSVCDQCRCLRFCADASWIQERQAWWAKEGPKEERAQHLQSDRLAAFLRDFAEYSDKKLERIAAPSLFSGYDEVARAAARQLLAERRANPQPQEPEQTQQPEPRPGWTKGKNSKPPWEG